MAKVQKETAPMSDKMKALQMAMEKIDKTFGKGSIMRMGEEKVCSPWCGWLSQGTHH